MALIARDVIGIFQREAELLSALDESIAANEIVIAVDAWAPADDFTIPRTLQRPNTPVTELSRADWSDPEQLAGEVVPFLGQLCTFWENVYGAHESAIDRFRTASGGGAPYCFYLRSFRHVVTSDDDDRDVRVALYHITKGLDFALEQALSRDRRAINPVSCLHTDDLALSTGEFALPAIRVHGHSWQEPIEDAIRAGKVIVFYVGAPSEVTDVELVAIRKARLRHRTILVYEEAAHLPADAAEFAARFSLAEFLTSPKSPLTARLTAKARTRVTELMSDAFKSPAPSKTLLDLRCSVVDPDLTKELPGTVNRHNVLCVTPANLSAFACYVVGFPDAVRDWEAIAMRPASRKAKSGAMNVNELQATANYAFGGAVALGLTASIAAATGLRVVFSNFSRLAGAKAKAKRKAASLDVLAIHWFDADAFLAEASRLLRLPGWLVIYTSGFTGTIVEDATFPGWFKAFLSRFPTPPRSRVVLTDAIAAAHGFQLRGEESFANDVPMSADAFVDYQLSTTNIIAATERGDTTPDEAAAWMRESIASFFRSSPQRTFRFAGSITYLARQTA